MPAFATDYYVDAVSGNNANSGLSQILAKQTIQAAANLTLPGDTVYILNGTYEVTSVNGNVLNMTRSGAAGQYITFKPMAGHSPKIKASGGAWEAIIIDGSYVILDGLELEGNNANLTYSAAYQSWQNYENNIKDWSVISGFNTNGISIGKQIQIHHVIIRNCKVHDFPGGGIGGGKLDYITVENNVVYNNSWYTMYATSGISFLNPKNYDTTTGYKILIQNNIVYNNKTTVPWEQTNGLSDGNGIILDVNDGYTGRTLVENNVSYNNGGGGIHAFRANHIDIINNTAYNNGTVVGYPEIDAQQATDVKIYNNIMYGRGSGTRCNGNDPGAIYDYNVYFNGTSYKNGPNDITGDPKFVNKALDGTANFQLLNTSPAINNGSSVAGQFTTTDILGISRPVGFSSDMGAYEFPTVIPRAEMNVTQGTTTIFDNTGSFDFGSVASTVPQIVTFTIQNIGDLALDLTGTPKVVVAGTGFTLETDAPATVSASGTVTFQVKLTTTTVGVYSGTISIANSDANENPYNFAITGYGYDGTKALQTITFNELPVKVIGNPDFDPGATTTSGLPITYTSSNGAVATIVAGQIRITGAGTSTITASQAGDSANNPANNVSQILTVTPVLPPAGSNLIANPSFDTDTTGWTFANKNGGATTLATVTLPGYDSNVAKVTVTSIGTSSGIDNIQFSYNRVFIVKGKNYLVSFRGSTDVARNVNLVFIMSGSPYTTYPIKSTIPLTTTPTNFGLYTFTSNFTGYVDLRFHLGGSTSLNNPVYLDNVSVIEEVSLGVNKFEIANEEVYAYPNPAKDIVKVYFSGKSKENVTIGLYNLQGILLKERKYTGIIGKTPIEFPVDSVANGMYLLRTIDSNGSMKAIKVLINN